MNRSALQPRERGKAPGARWQSRGFVDGGGLRDSKGSTNRSVLVMDRRRLNARRASDGLASALLMQRNDLALILKTVDEISRNLKSNPAAAGALSKALHRSVSRAVKWALLDRELRSMALTDDLTGLYNRRAFHTLAAQELKVMRRRGQGFLLFFADVDHLKRINDAHGHREGDLALLRCGQALGRTFRKSDIVARLGGDEFAVLALDASSQDEGTILRRLESQLEKASGGEPHYKLSLSVGCAKFEPKRSLSLADLLAKADQAMYEKKNKRLKLCSSSAMSRDLQAASQRDGGFHARERSKYTQYTCSH